MSLFDRGDERLKLAVHGVALTLDVEMGLYNFIVWKRRGTNWHLFCAVVYGSLVLLEIGQVTRHAHG